MEEIVCFLVGRTMLPDIADTLIKAMSEKLKNSSDDDF